MVDSEQIIEAFKKAPTIEILTEERLKQAIESGVKLKHYIGFEVSGFVHLGLGIVSMQKVADLQLAGVETSIFLADYHAWINKKLGGDLSTIRRVAKSYFGHALKASLKCVNGKPEKAKFVLASRIYEKASISYLENVLKVSMGMSLSRAKRSITILGRKQAESISFAQLLYVPMQVADIYTLGVNIAHGGIDQRKAHVIAIDVANRFSYKPIALHHELLTGIQLNEEQRKRLIEAKKSQNRELLDDVILDAKMSKSKPNSAIFIHDGEEEIRAKLRKAYCPAKELEFNPVVEILRLVVMPYLRRKERVLEIVNEKTKERRLFESFEEFAKEYALGRIHPLDLKNAIANVLIEMLEPARKEFSKGAGKKALEELKALKITR